MESFSRLATSRNCTDMIIHDHPNRFGKQVKIGCFQTEVKHDFFEYFADVGQGAWEEVDVVPAGQGGLNFRWNIMEGSHCYGGGSCASTGLPLPAIEYDHSEGCSIIGGFVYRGGRLPARTGRYLYADYCGDWIRSFAYSGEQPTGPKSSAFDSIGHILSFGKDSAGELYVLCDTGRVYRIGPAGKGGTHRPGRAKPVVPRCVRAS